VVARAAKASNTELPALAAELAALKPNVLVAMSTPPSLALKGATTSIPIVVLAIGDPIGSHLVQSLAHPGGNVTGTANAVEQWVAKQFEGVTEVLPGIRCVLTLRNTENQSIMMLSAQIEKLAAKLGFELRPVNVASGDELDRALGTPPADDCKTAMVLPLDGLFISRGAQIVDYALRNRIALFTEFAGDAEAGALMTFGIDLDAQWRLGADYVDKILKGARPEDLPVQQPIKFEIVVNLKTARAIGVTIPQSILAAADKVIE
jgi:putative tryptophan/tyrosine transport system substrate-binding protein